MFRLHANIEHGSKTKTKPLARFASLFVPDFIFAHTHTHPSDYIFMVLWISMPRHQSLEKPLHMKMMRTNNNEQDTNTHKKSVPEHPFRFQRWFLYCHLIYGFTGNADCIMRPLTMFSSNFIFKTNSTFTISFAYCSHASIFSAFIFCVFVVVFG